MPEPANRILISLIRPPLMVIGFLGGKLYAALFGRADKRLAEQNRNRFGAEVRSDFAFLFEQYGATVAPHDTSAPVPPFDYASLELHTGNLIFHFTRGRGEFSVEIAPRHSPHDGYMLSRALFVLTGREDLLTAFPSEMSGVALLLEPAMAQLNAAFSEEKYPELRIHLTEMKKYDEAVTRQTQAEINRRLYDR